LLEVADLHTYFGKSHVLQGVTLDVGDGEVVSILGRNGAGKTTTLRSIMGIARSRTGAVRWNGADLLPLGTHTITRMGIAYVPEDRRIFSDLTVEENLRIAGRDGGAWDVAAVFDLFPSLKERRRLRGTNLSGGEQQMLAIGRALMTNPSLLLLDEPSQGLAPIVVEQLLTSLLELKAHGLSILLVEQALEVAASLSDRDYIIEHGQVVHATSGANVLEDRSTLERYLGV
jgi:branched-chain amino acid transport system ATP-binding protein